MKKQFRVELTEDERHRLRRLVSVGEAPARKLVRARILLLADEADGGLARTDAEIAHFLCCGRATVERVRKRFSERGLSSTLQAKPTVRTYTRRLNGQAEAHLLAMAFSEPPPNGRPRWSLRLLGDRLVDLGFVDSVSHETVRRTLRRKQG
jgi:homeodomain-containing protein